MSKRAGPRGFKLWLFRGVAVLLPFVLLVLVELVLRVVGVAKPEPLFLEVRTPTQHKFQTNPDVALRDFPIDLARIMPSPGFQAFDVEKPEGLLRVFCLGASTTAGFPLPVHLSFPSLLQEKLRLYLPDKRLEVINCGISAVASFTVVDFTREVLQRDADLIIVYTGHNEFYGAWGAASTAGPGGAPGWLLRPLRWLQRLRIWRWLSSRLGEPEVAPGTLMERMVAKPAVDPAGALHRTALQDYKKNIRKMIRICRKAGVPVLLCEPVSNLRDHYPFGTLMPGDLSSVQERRLELWRLEREAADRNLTTEEVYERWREIIREDSTSSDLWFHGGWLARDSGLNEEAAAAFVKARDWDTVHFRACTAFLDGLREVCLSEGVPIVPLVERFEQDPVPGNDLFIEHVHPNLRGQILVADAICDVLAEMSWPDSEATWEREDDPGPWVTLALAGLTPLDVHFADLRVAQLKKRWPYTTPLGMELTAKERLIQADPYKRYEDRSLYAEAQWLWEKWQEDVSPEDSLVFEDAVEWPEELESAVDQVAERALLENGDILEAHSQLGGHYFREGRYAEAFREYRSAARLFPVDGLSFFNAGYALRVGGYPERARNYYFQALTLSPGSIRFMAGMADVELALDRADLARVWVDRILAVDPQNRSAQLLLGRIEADEGQP